MENGRIRHSHKQNNEKTLGGPKVPGVSWSSFSVGVIRMSTSLLLLPPCSSSMNLAASFALIDISEWTQCTPVCHSALSCSVKSIQDQCVCVCSSYNYVGVLSIPRMLTCERILLSSSSATRIRSRSGCLTVKVKGDQRDAAEMTGKLKSNDDLSCAWIVCYPEP